MSFLDASIHGGDAGRIEAEERMSEAHCMGAAEQDSKAL